MSDNLVGLATKDRRPNLHYDLINPETGLCYKCSNKGWRYSQETIAQKIAEKRIIWPKSASGRPRHKKFLCDLKSQFAGFSSLVQCGNTNEGTEEVQKMFGAASFIFPKPRSLIQTLIAQATDGNDFILDSFAGSGTTGHAVLAQNNLDNGSRRFILVEMDAKICNDITATRLKKAITGYGEEPGLSGGFSYCELGSPLFDETGQIKPEVTFLDLARHVFFTETGSPLPEKAEKNFPLLGVASGVGVYLLYNGVLKDKRPDSGNILTIAVLRSLPPHDGPRVIYGVGCRIGPARLAQEGITFHQIPYAIKVS